MTNNTAVIDLNAGRVSMFFNNAVVDIDLNEQLALTDEADHWQGFEDKGGNDHDINLFWDETAIPLLSVYLVHNGLTDTRKGISIVILSIS